MPCECVGERACVCAYGRAAHPKRALPLPIERAALNPLPLRLPSFIDRSLPPFRFTFSGDGHTFSVLVDSGFAYVAVAEEG